MDLSKLYQTQISFTEWLQRINHKDAEAHRKEDNEKRERLAVLNDVFGLPFDRPTQFSATEVAERSEGFVKFLNEHGDELCAFRLMPFDHALPKLRTRGASVRDTLVWFEEQKIDPTQYKVDVVPHTDAQVWVTIFVVNEKGAFGQIAHCRHSQLTQGFYENDNVPMTFVYDFSQWQIVPEVEGARQHLEILMNHLRVSDPAAREVLQCDLGATFAGEHLCGYFETTTSDEFGVWFVDYNRILGASYSGTSVILSDNEGSSAGILRGQIGSKGKATGRARVIRVADLAGADIEEGDIIVTDMTTPDFLPMMQKSGGVVTAWGGILSHAAIVCRELGKPCLTNAKGVLDSIQDGSIIEVDAEKGAINLL